MSKKIDVHFSKLSNDWRTPKDLFLKLHKEFSFVIDLCASSENHLLPNYYSRLDSCLYKSFPREACFMNPPYGDHIHLFIEKAFKESLLGSTVVCLIPSRTETHYWQDYVMKAPEIRFIKGRLKFSSSKIPAPFPSSIVVFKKEKRRRVYPRVISYEV